jgi:hypothetical protein
MMHIVLAGPEYRIQAYTLVVRCPNHDAMDGPNFRRVKFIQYKIENLSLKTLQMEEVGLLFGFFLKKMSETYHLSLK